MPFTLLAHQAPALLLRNKSLRYFSIFWFSLGTIVPDLELLFRENFHSIYLFEFYWDHSLFGQFFWTIPISLVFGYIFFYIIKFNNQLISRKPILNQIINDISIQNQFTKDGFMIAVLSSFIGGFSHIILDSFTHSINIMLYPFIIIDYHSQELFVFSLFTQRYSITILDIMLYIFSIVFGLLVIYYIIDCYKELKLKIYNL